MWRYWKYTYQKTSSVLVLFFFYFGVVGQNIDQNAVDLLLETDSSLQNTNGMKFRAEMYARLKDEDYHQKADFKIQRNPLKVYYKQFYGNNIELLYDETVNKEKALVNPDGFPFTNLHLSPNSPLILKRQHHNVFEADPIYTIKQILNMVEDCKPDKCLVKLSDTLINYKELKVLTYNNPQYKIVEYRVQKEIELLELANKLGLNFYSIVCLNRRFDSDTEIDEGEYIKIPTSYAKRIVLIIDPEEESVFEVQVYDKKGLFEKMRYISFEKDVEFSKMDFSDENPEYNF
jgi:hypothetical protein